MSRGTATTAAAWKLLLLPAVMTALLGISAPAANAAGKGATAVMEQAIKQRSAGDLTGAIRNLRAAVDASESQAQRSLAGFMLGDCLMEAKKPAEAAEIYQSIISGNPSEEEHAEALFRLAQCSKSMGDLAGMKKFCRQITSNHPDSPFAELAGLLSKSAAAEQAASEARTAATGPTETPAETETPIPVPAVPPQPDKAQADTPAPSTRPVPVYEGVDQDTISAMQAKSEPAKPPMPAPSKQEEEAPAQAEQQVSPRPEPPQETAVLQGRETRKPERRGPSQAVADIADLVALPPLSGEEREALATQILQDQEQVKANPTAPGTDDILARIGEATARFGEPVEACKAYDRILTDFPQSKQVERAYFEGIRLRAVIGLRPMVSQWGRVFLETFPKSRRVDDVRRLVAWADQSASDASPAPTATRTKKPAASAPSRDYSPEKDPRYRQAKRRVADNRFTLAMNDFQGLTDAHPDVPVFWWELALVQIQLQRYDEAEESLNRLLALQPDNQDARSLLGYVHYHQKDYTQAADDYRQAGASESDGLKFFDSQTAARRMERSSKTAKPSSTREGENE